MGIEELKHELTTILAEEQDGERLQQLLEAFYAILYTPSADDLAAIQEGMQDILLRGASLPGSKCKPSIHSGSANSCQQTC